jgi:Gtr1/RagA G protein conserved region
VADKSKDVFRVQRVDCEHQRRYCHILARKLTISASTTNLLIIGQHEEKGANALCPWAHHARLMDLGIASGSSHGRVGQWQNLHALSHLVRFSTPFSFLAGRTQHICNEYSSSNPASLTARLGATIDVEQNHVRFLGDLILNLWDCGGQDSFMESYLSTQRSTIFQHVAVLIYVFDVETRQLPKDLQYYRDCLDGLKKYSPDAKIFLLVHKMDLVRGERAEVLEKRRAALKLESSGVEVTVFGTSIYNESLYKVCRSRPSSYAN